MGFFDRLFKTIINKIKQNHKVEPVVERESIVEIEPVKPVEDIKKGSVSSYNINLGYHTADNLKKRYIALDVETTGLSAYVDRIVEVGAVIFEDGEVVKKYSSLVNAEVSISPNVTAINHITNDMISSAPLEKEVYSELIDFLGDALDGQTVICAHNAKFDISFLSETFIRLGYDAKIDYVDTLELSRSLIEDVENYRLNTVAAHFGILNEHVHRAVSDSEVCGRILWELLKLKDEEKERMYKEMEKNIPTHEELEVCAYIQDMITKNGGDTQWLGFIRDSRNYVDITNIVSFLRLRFTPKGNYIIVKKSALKDTFLYSKPCLKSEGGEDFVRLYFHSAFDLQSLTEYIVEHYHRISEFAIRYYGDKKRCEEEAKNSIVMLKTLTSAQVEELLIAAEKRRSDAYNSRSSIKGGSNTKDFVQGYDISINPVNNRVPLESIHNLNDWGKGAEEGYKYWEVGEQLRKARYTEEAIFLFDKARFNGYCSPMLYESYAAAYHKLKDYDNEIAILDEGIERGKSKNCHSVRLEELREKAVYLLYKQQEAKKKKEMKLQEALRKSEAKKMDVEAPKKPKGHPVEQLSKDMVLIKRYNSISQATRETGINSKSIRNAIKGLQKHAGGFLWREVTGT